jgi:PAS domain S-box-containing protein
MSNTAEKLQHELQAAQRELSEAKARCNHHDAEHQADTKELWKSHHVLLSAQEDIERSRHQVERAHQEWMAALDVVEDPIFLHDKQLRILRCNKAYQQCAGIPFKQIIGQPYYEIFPKTGAPLACCLRVMEKAEDAAGEEEITVGAIIYRLRVFSVHDAQGGYLHSAHILENITESRRAEVALHDSEEKLHKITESAQDAIIMMGSDQRISFWNAAAERIFGYTATEAMGQELHALITPAKAHAKFALAFPHFQVTGEGALIGKVTEVMALHKDGTEFPAELSISSTRLNGQWQAISILRDITERKQAEAVLSDSVMRYRTMIESSNDMIWTLSADGKFTFINQQAADITGRSVEDWLGKSFEPLVLEEDLPMVLEVHRKIMRGEKVHYEVRGKKADGEILILFVNASPIYKGGKVRGTISFARDITEQKRAEVAIAHANRALTTLSTVNRTLVHASDEDELLLAICQAIIQQRGYQLAWVGYAQQDEQKSVKIMAHASCDGNYPDTMQPTWAEDEYGMGPAGRAIRSGETQVCQDIANDPHYRTWRDAALKRGYAASIALPLLNEEGNVFGILTVYSNEVNAFNPAEVDLLEEMAGDLAFGVRTLHTRHERDLAMEQSRQHLELLQNSLEDTVRAIAGIGEMRDPYTAGHQVRVADLATAIARQMGLSTEQIHAIHLAGVVHDLGKIRVPAEILSKPGKITDIEFSLIKTHSQAGYDILKGIDFPWPIALMVQQHHERLDGSGYPQGLKGDAILLEARILSVADVVEAISAHRPYRPGLGIEAALEEITKNRSKFFDPQVVDACLALFREQNYSFMG